MVTEIVSGDWCRRSQIPRSRQRLILRKTIIPHTECSSYYYFF